MTTTQRTTNSQETSNPSFAPGSTLPFESICQPGAYICNWSGHLLRVPADGVIPGRSPTINMVGNEPLIVTWISNDPFVPLTTARLQASNFDLNVSF